MQKEEVQSSSSEVYTVYPMARKSVFSVQKETRDLLHTHRKKHERRERTLKNWGRNSLKRRDVKVP